MKYIFANIKANKIKYLKYIDSLKNKELIKLIPPFTELDEINDPNIELGSQDVSKYNIGSYTGEIPADLLKDMGVKYTIVGHSERRHYFNETKYDFIGKINNLLLNKITPIYCIGETREEYMNKSTKEVLRKQLIEVLLDMKGEVIIAYEPVWAIGTGLVPTNEEITLVNEEIIKVLKELKIKKYKILYGGSVNKDNIVGLLKVSNLDGFLVGGASLDVNEMNKMTDHIKNSNK